MKPPIILVAFGTIMPKARRVYDHLESRARVRYMGHEVIWGFTASSVRRHMEKHEQPVLSPQEALARLRAAGHDQVVIQSFHVVPGEEYAHLEELDHLGMDVAVGTPLLSQESDLDTVIDAMAESFEPDIPNVVVAHGNDRFPAYNEQNILLDVRLRQRFKNVVVASLEGMPGRAPLQEIKSAAAAVDAVHFVPLMLVAGSHIGNDVLGDGDHSWKSDVGVHRVTCSGPLGLNDDIISIYFTHLDTALKSLKKVAVR